jgi:hypothetical protein
MINFLGATVRVDQPLDTQAISRRLLIVGDRTLGPGYLRRVAVENPSLK